MSGLDKDSINTKIVELAITAFVFGVVNEIVIYGLLHLTPIRDAPIMAPIIGRIAGVICGYFIYILLIDDNRNKAVVAMASTTTLLTASLILYSYSDLPTLMHAIRDNGGIQRIALFGVITIGYIAYYSTYMIFDVIDIIFLCYHDKYKCRRTETLAIIMVSFSLIFYKYITSISHNQKRNIAIITLTLGFISYIIRLEPKLPKFLRLENKSNRLATFITYIKNKYESIRHYRQ